MHVAPLKFQPCGTESIRKSELLPGDLDVLNVPMLFAQDSSVSAWVPMCICR